GARPPGSDAVARLPPKRTLPERRTRPARGPRQNPVGFDADRGGTNRAPPRTRLTRSRAVPDPSGDRGTPRRRTTRLARDRGALRRALENDRFSDRRNESGD